MVVFFLCDRGYEIRLEHHRTIFRTTKVILAVLTSSIVCGMPNAVVNIINCYMLSRKERISPTMYSTSLTTNAIVCLGSCLNPIVYTLLRRDIR